MPFSLDDLISDSRFERLFADKGGDCALQLWILQLKISGIVESRMVYGRLLPYHHSTTKWTLPNDDDFRPLGDFHAQVIRLNLYMGSQLAADVLKGLCAGTSLQILSDELEIELAPRHATRVGAVSIGQTFNYRPPIYLLNRDSIRDEGPLSPHGSSGAFSASVSSKNKDALLRTNAGYDSQLAKFIVDRLNEETGFDFGGKDLSRLGELELLMFPTLDDYERELLTTDWKDNSSIFEVRLKLTRLTSFVKFSVKLDVTCGTQLAYSAMAITNRADNDDIVCEFEVPAKLRKIVDGTEVEIHGFTSAGGLIGSLCCRWHTGYFREVSIAGTIADQQPTTVRLPWLEKVTPSQAAAQRLSAVQTILPYREITNTIADRSGDPWVPVNRNLHALWSKLIPPKSEGRFFDELVDGNGLGRLDFSEWFKKQLVKHENKHIVIFDPYFEDAGIGLVIPNASVSGNYTIFTTLTHPDNEEKPRINHLRSACEQLRPLLKGIKLKVYGLEYKAFHDRYFLVLNHDGTPAAGFNFSNSIQAANENYPFLVTPIPGDVLIKVCAYARGVLSVAGMSQGDDGLLPIFDSTAPEPNSVRHHEPLAFLDDVQAGPVLSALTGQSSLSLLTGDGLKDKLTSLGLLTTESAAFPTTPGLRGCIELGITDYDRFQEMWKLAGEVIANMSTSDWFRQGDWDGADLFKQQLLTFIEESFDRSFEGDAASLRGVIPEYFFAKSFDHFASTARSPGSFFNPAAHSILTSAEFAAVRILWSTVPEALMKMAEIQSARLPKEVTRADLVRLALLSEVTRLAALCVEFKLSAEQQKALLDSDTGLFKWLGVHSILGEVKRHTSIEPLVTYTATLERQEKIKTLGWFTKQFASRPQDVAIYEPLVTLLQGALPEKAAKTDLVLLTDSLRGNMRGLSWSEPWLFSDIVYPMVERHQVNADDVCVIWMQELTANFDEMRTNNSTLFKNDVEGRLLEIVAWSFGNSSAQTQGVVLANLKALLKRVTSDVQRPLASTLNWSAWNTSLTLALWIFALSKSAAFYLERPCYHEPLLLELQTNAKRLALFRPLSEWNSGLRAEPGGLADFVRDMWD